MTEITNFSAGTSVNILSILGRADLTHRMEAMGIAPGKKAQIIRIIGKAIVLQTGHSRIALRTSSQLQIMAEENLSSQRAHSSSSLNYVTS